MSLASILSAFQNRLRSRNGARLGRGKPLSRPVPQLTHLEDRCLLAIDLTLPQSYGTPQPTKIGDVMHDIYNNSSVPNVPQKLFTFFNNSNKTVYPILNSANSNIGHVDGGTPVGRYDPFDPMNQEYRGYIAHFDTVSKTIQLGLRAQEQVTIVLPLVFWDAGTIEIATNGSSPLQDDNVWGYKLDDKTKAITVNAEPGSSAGGMVMWYHRYDVAKNLGHDASTQLIEMTVRDACFKDTAIFPDVPASERKTLISYDVSYVNNLMLPIAMAAADAPVDFEDQTSPKLPYAWVGADDSYDQLQSAIQTFTSDYSTSNGLGTYFGGKGFDKYWFPNTDVGSKIPSGQFLFAEGALANIPTDYIEGKDALGNFRYRMASGGEQFKVSSLGGAITRGDTKLNITEPSKIAGVTKGMFVDAPNSIIALGTTIKDIAADLSWVTLSRPAVGDGPSTQIYNFLGSKTSLKVNTDGSGTTKTLTIDPTKVDQYALKALGVGMQVLTGQGATTGATVISITPPTSKNKMIVLTLDTKVTALKGTYTYTFVGPPADYLVTTLINNWYMWADYYVERNKGITTKTSGGMTHGPLVPNLANPQLEALCLKLDGLDSNVVQQLVKGMQVTSSGTDIVQPDGLTETRITTITDIDLINNSITLSVPAKSAQTNNTYTFLAPPKVIGSDDVKAPTLDFTTDDAKKEADKFAYVVYDVMTGFRNLPNNPGSYLSGPAQLLSYCIGCNVGSFVGPNALPSLRQNEGLRDELKSLMRGVYNFNEIPQFVGGQRKWYPNPADPKDPKSGTVVATINSAPATFGVYNLNPYVYFVHVTLGFSGYGFSVDDDIANPNVNGASKLLIGITKLDGMPIKQPWTEIAPWGPVSVFGEIKSTDTKKIVNLVPIDDAKDHTVKVVLAQVRGNGNYGNGARIAPVVAGKIVEGTNTIATIDQGAQTIALNMDGTPNGPKQKFWLYGPGQTPPRRTDDTYSPTR